jgi:hypothetical protein
LQKLLNRQGERTSEPGDFFQTRASGVFVNAIDRAKQFPQNCSSALIGGNAEIGRATTSQQFGDLVKASGDSTIDQRDSLPG